MSEPYKKANRKFHPDDTVVDVGGHKIGGGYFAVMSGPCSVESKEQITYVAQRVQGRRGQHPARRRVQAPHQPVQLPGSAC